MRADLRGCPRARRATTLGDLENPSRHAACALADLLPDPSQAAREHSDPIGQERGVRGLRDVGFENGGVDAETPAADDAARAGDSHQAVEDILEHRFVEHKPGPDPRMFENYYLNWLEPWARVELATY